MISGIVRARNTPGTGPYCNRQPLKIKQFHGSNEPRKLNTTKFVVYFEHENLQYSVIAQVCYSDCCQFCSSFLAAIDKLITLLSTVYQGEQAKIVLLPDNVQLSANSWRNFSSNRISVPSFSMAVNCGGCGQWSCLKLQQSLGSVMFCWFVNICIYLHEFPLYGMFSL